MGRGHRTGASGAAEIMSAGVQSRKAALNVPTGGATADAEARLAEVRGDVPCRVNGVVMRVQSQQRCRQTTLPRDGLTTKTMTAPPPFENAVSFSALMEMMLEAARGHDAGRCEARVVEQNGQGIVRVPVAESGPASERQGSRRDDPLSELSSDKRRDDPLPRSSSRIASRKQA